MVAQRRRRYPSSRTDGAKFHAAFGLGEDDRRISTVDEEGIALAAIKALQNEIAAKDRRLAGLNARLVRLKATVDVLSRRRRSSIY